MAKPPLHIDASKAIRQAKAAHRDLSLSTRNRAVAHALNVVARKARVAAVREIKSIYKIRSKDLTATSTRRKGIGVIKARPTQLESTVLAIGRPLPIMAFGPRIRRKGVSVNIMGKRKVFKHAFKATMKSGHIGIFVRSEYSKYHSGKLVARKQRVKGSKGPDTPIVEVLTVGVATAFSNDAVMRHLFDKIETDLPLELSRAFNYFSGAKGGGGIASLY